MYFEKTSVLDFSSARIHCSAAQAMPKKPISASALKSGLGGGAKGKAKFGTTGDLSDGQAEGELRPRRRSARIEPKKFARELGSGSETVAHGHGVAHMAERLCGVMGPGVVQVIAVLEKASHQQFVRGSELMSLLAKLSNGADAIEALRLVHELLEMHSMRLDFNWVHASPLLDALLQQLEAAAATWLRAQLAATILLDTDAWSLTKLGEAVRVLKAGGVPQLEEFVASNAEPQPLAALNTKASHADMWQEFKDEWQKMHVHLSDISGFPSWMPQLQELVWGRFEQLYYLFHSYASRAHTSGPSAHSFAVCMGPSEFYMIVHDAKLTSGWLNAARVDELFEAVRAHYDVDADGLPVAGRGRHLHGFTRLHAFLEAVVRLALLTQGDPTHTHLPKLPFPDSLGALLEQNLERVECDLEFEQVVRRAVGAPAVRDALASHGDVLRRAFATAARPAAAASQGASAAAAAAAAQRSASQRPAVSLRAWLGLVKRAQLPIGKDVATEIFLSSQAAALRHMMHTLQQESGGGDDGGGSGGGGGGGGGGGAGGCRVRLTVGRDAAAARRVAVAERTQQADARARAEAEARSAALVAEAEAARRRAEEAASQLTAKLEATQRRADTLRAELSVTEAKLQTAEGRRAAEAQRARDAAAAAAAALDHEAEARAAAQRDVEAQRVELVSVAEERDRALKQREREVCGLNQQIDRLEAGAAEAARLRADADERHAAVRAKLETVARDAVERGAVLAAAFESEKSQAEESRAALASTQLLLSGEQLALGAARSTMRGGGGGHGGEGDGGGDGYGVAGEWLGYCGDDVAALEAAERSAAEAVLAYARGTGPLPTRKGASLEERLATLQIEHGVAVAMLREARRQLEARRREQAMLLGESVVLLQSGEGGLRERDTLRRELSQLRWEHEALETTLDELRTMLREERDTHQLAASDAERALAQQVQRAKQAAVEAAAAHAAQVVELRQHGASVQAELDGARSRERGLDELLASARAENAALTAARAAADAEAARLGDECATLRGLADAAARQTASAQRRAAQVEAEAAELEEARRKAQREDWRAWCLAPRMPGLTLKPGGLGAAGGGGEPAACAGSTKAAADGGVFATPVLDGLVQAHRSPKSTGNE